MRLGGEAAHQRRQERIGAEQPGRASDTTSDPINNSLIDGADKRLAQSTEHTCAQLHKWHTRKTLASYQPQHQSPAPSKRSPGFFFFQFFLSSLPELVVLLWILGSVGQYRKGGWREMWERDKEKGKRGSLCELWFTCVVGSTEYAFRHFWSCSLAHSAFLSSVWPLPWAALCVSTHWTLESCPSEVKAKHGDCSWTFF